MKKNTNKANAATEPSQAPADVAAAQVVSQNPPALAIWGGLAALAVLFLLGIFTTSLPLYIDESSIAYNAFTIAKTGADEYGTRWPLYFKAFGEYKNPLYIYVLALFLKIFGASTLVARALSALAMIAAIALLGKLAKRISGHWQIGLAVAALAALTPWLFEVSRLVFEVNFLPLLLVWFLFALYNALQRGSTGWTLADCAQMGLALALLTYSYSIGRLYAPLLAFGLLLLLKQAGWSGVLRTWVVFGLGLIPLALYQVRNPGALGGRFRDISYIGPDKGIFEMALAFVQHFFSNLNPFALLVSGDPNPLHHLPFMGSFLAGAFVLAVIGLVLVWRNHRHDLWYRYVVFGLLVSVLPASLTNDDLYTLRLMPFPFFLFLLMIPALVWWWRERKNGEMSPQFVGLLLVVAGLQGAVFQLYYYQKNSLKQVDLGYHRVLEAALATPNRPLCVLADGPGHFGYAHAYWQAAQRGEDLAQIVRLNDNSVPPPNAVVVAEAAGLQCPACQVVKKLGPYVAYIAPAN